MGTTMGTGAPLAHMLAYLALGSNMGDSRGHIERAIAEIDALPWTRVLRAAPFYGTGPWGKTDQPDFVNTVVEVLTEIEPRALLIAVKNIEQAHGREPGERWGPRPLDIDILLHGGGPISEPGLQIPHPRMWDRAFVLRPLADLLPDLNAPDGRTIMERLNDEDIASQSIWRLE